MNRAEKRRLESAFRKTFPGIPISNLYKTVDNMKKDGIFVDDGKLEFTPGLDLQKTKDKLEKDVRAADMAFIERGLEPPRIPGVNIPPKTI